MNTSRTNKISFMWFGLLGCALAHLFGLPAPSADPPLRITRIHASTDDRDNGSSLSFPPGVRMVCQAELEHASPSGVTVRWEFRKGGTPVTGVILVADGTKAAFRLPSEEGRYEVLATARNGSAEDRFSLSVEVKRRSYPAVPPVGGPEQPGAHLQRTMSLLATSTPDDRHPVRILFYGQSITKQDWVRTVSAYLREHYPYADFTIANRAIGGYSSPFLIRTLPHDVYSFYPDLVIFHDYGDEPLYEQIIAGIRSHTTAEILLQSDRPSPPSAKGPDTSPWHERHSLVWMPELATRYKLEWADLWRPWRAYLAANHLQPGDVLRDGAHYTLQGDDMVAQITKRYLVYRPDLPVTDAQTVRTYEAGRDFVWKDGRLRLEFDGNRVDAIAGWDNPFHGGSADVLIDGKRPSEIADLYTVTLPTDTYAVDWPAINRVSHERPLKREDWTLRVLSSAEGDRVVRFSVTGSVTGPDGEGVSTERFVSKSGRVVIEPRDWGMKRAYDLKHQATPAGFEVHWSVEGNFLDTWQEPRIEDPSKEHSQALALGLKNGPHTLELIARDPAMPPMLRAIRTYRPPVRESNE